VAFRIPGQGGAEDSVLPSCCELAGRDVLARTLADPISVGAAPGARLGRSARRVGS